MSTTWTEASEVDEERTHKVIAHLATTGALDEAAELMQRLQNGTETSELMSLTEVEERMARFFDDGE